MKNFTVLASQEIPEFRARGIWLEHANGCQIFHILNDDEENLFAFIFKTFPMSSNGLPHIMEHSVLSGSKHFPLKDPFAALRKGSMHTFLNAMTYPDRTIYPASSTVKKDFFNLLHVYGDAVFFPLLRREIFHQEGFHIALDREEKPRFSGIVFNEMKGSYSSHESLAAEWSYRPLFPDTAYRFDSGGDPAEIPNLTYEEFLRYHETYYHPSNAKIFLYGNIATEEITDFLQDHFLRFFDGKKDHPSLPDEQKKWSAPQFIEKTSPLGKDEDPADKSTIMMNWLLPEVSDRETALELEILSEIFIGNDGAPLQKALIDSGLGQDISPVSGLEKDLRNCTFTIALRGTNPDRKKDFEKTVMNELRLLRKNGIPEDALDGALHRVEFRNREISSGLPYGLKLLGRSVESWIYGTSPFESLRFDTEFTAVSKRIRENPEYLKNQIQKLFLDNNHRTSVILRPDQQYAEDFEKKLQSLLEKKQIQGGDNFFQNIKKENAALRNFQKEPDSREAENTIPCLRLQDLPMEVQKIYLSEEKINDVPFFIHDTFTNGILYGDFAFPIHGIDPSLSPFLPLFARAVTSSGLPGIPFDKTARDLSIKTGGFTAALEASSIPLTHGKGREYLFFRVKMLEQKEKDALSLIFRLLLEADFSDKKRISDLLVEMRNDLKARLIPNGNSFASLTAASLLSYSTAREESWRGINQYLFLDNLVKDKGKGIEACISAFNELRRTVLTRSGLSLSLTGDAGGISSALDFLRGELSSMPEGIKGAESIEYPELSQEPVSGIDEFIPLPSTVGFAASVFPSSRFGEPLHPYQSILSHLLSTGFLWNEIRMKNGAYGASAQGNGIEGFFLFSSYRDPHFFHTPKIFLQAIESASDSFFSKETLHKAIIGTISKEAKPIPPGIRGFIGLRRRLYEITDNLRQEKRDRILSAEPRDIMRAAEALLQEKENSFTVCLGPQPGKDAEEFQPAIGRTRHIPL